jgi:protein-S-isoprenylcysteine O-methyltransferase Ste14
MEAPSPVLVALFWAGSPSRGEPVPIVFLALWLVHYVYRTLVFPFLGRRKQAPMPLSIATSAFAFNLVNGTIQGLGVFHLGPSRDPSWFLDPRFLGGLLLFVAGFAIHARADAVLRGLRAPGETAYRVPRGFLFERVSCPNYLGEIVEWSGWALLTWSLSGLSFAFWSVANLAPRALAHHRWYRERFPDYPRERRALLPLLL